MSGEPKDLIVLTADKDAQFAVQELLRRPGALKTRPVESDVFAYNRHDAGVFNKAHEFLRPFGKQHRYAIVVFDHEGCGRERQLRETIEKAVEDRLTANGWEHRCAAIVIAPELESWLWDGSLQVNRLLDWRTGELTEWLESRAFPLIDGKPQRPKEAFLSVLRHRKIQRSSALYQQLAREFRFEGCQDVAFRKFLTTLRTWFPPPEK